MIKKIISPFQKVLLKKRLCVGCTQPLDKARRWAYTKETREFVECKCKRRYILDKETNTYRRASFEEEALFLTSKKG